MRNEDLAAHLPPHVPTPASCFDVAGGARYLAWSALASARADIPSLLAGLLGLARVSVARYRLRFLLQEVDLPQGETVIGRSATCHITIEDPLVSRRHARIIVAGDRVTIEDLGSRNGLVVAGRPAFGAVDVSSGVRVRIGTQELVLCRGAEEPLAPPRASITGFMIHCAGCGFPYAAEHVSCPHCGSDARCEDTTLSGNSKQAWSLDLVVETVRRAEALGRWQDVERVLRQGQRVLEEIMSSTDPLDRERLDELAHFAVALALERGQADWGSWVLGVYAALGRIPPSHIGRSLGRLPAPQRALLAPAAEQILRTVLSRGARPPSVRPAAEPVSLSGEAEIARREDDLDALRQLAGADDASCRGAGVLG